MNRIVRERYPVSQLPEDLRAGFTADRPVSIVIVQDEPDTASEASHGSIQGGNFTSFKHLRRANFASSADVDAYIDDLRNEWVHQKR